MKDWHSVYGGRQSIQMAGTGSVVDCRVYGGLERSVVDCREYMEDLY